MRATLRKDTLEPWLRPGVFLYWQGQRLRLLPGDRSDLLRLQVEDLLTQEQRTLRIEELLLPQGDDPAPPIFALTLEGLQAEIERQHPPPAPLHA